MKLRKRRRRTLKGGNPVSPVAQTEQKPVNTTELDAQIKQTEATLTELKSKRDSIKGSSSCSIM